MRVAIMQPYLLPYIGYFQLMSATDQFVVYDNIKYTKKGWINRNRISINGKDAFFTIPLKAGSDADNVVEKFVSESFNPTKMLNKFHGAYQKSPFFDETFSLLELVFTYKAENLFDFIFHSLKATARHLEMRDNFVVASSIPADHSLTAQDKVIDICTALGATQYINPEGGMSLYSRQVFAESAIELKFLRSKAFQYQQKHDAFLPNLSISDVLMFNSRQSVAEVIQRHFDYI